MGRGVRDCRPGQLHAAGQIANRQDRLARIYYDRAAALYEESSAAALPSYKIVCYQSSAGNLATLGRWGEAYRHATIAMNLTSHSGRQDKRLLAEVRFTRVSLLWAITIMVMVIAAVLFLILLISWNAGRRGYAPLLWLAAAACSGFPLANLVALASLPDLRVEFRRRRIRSQLEALGRTVSPQTPAPSQHDRSPGDLTTQLW